MRIATLGLTVLMVILGIIGCDGYSRGFVDGRRDALDKIHNAEIKETNEPEAFVREKKKINDKVHGFFLNEDDDKKFVQVHKNDFISVQLPDCLGNWEMGKCPFNMDLEGVAHQNEYWTFFLRIKGEEFLGTLQFSAMGESGTSLVTFHIRPHDWAARN